MHLNWKFFLFEQKIQQELEVQQKKVDNLQDMVVVVDDTNTESGKGSGWKEVGGGVAIFAVRGQSNPTRES